MFGQPYDHSLLMKYIILFGTMFNNIVIERGRPEAREKLRVPISFGPREKHLARNEGNTKEGEKKTAILLPRIAYEMTSVTYAPMRKMPTLNKLSSVNEGEKRGTYQSVPYDLTFNLSIIGKTLEDVTKIAEQIIPYFTPEFTISAKLIDGLDDVTDIPIVLNSVVPEDNYDSPFDERRTIIYNIDFTMRVYFWGPVKDSKIIKFVDIRYISPTTNQEFTRTTIQPGLTANGQPTTDITQTLPFEQISPDDDWDYIIQYGLPIEEQNE